MIYVITVEYVDHTNRFTVSQWLSAQEVEDSVAGTVLYFTVQLMQQRMTSAAGKNEVRHFKWTCKMMDKREWWEWRLR